jgi:hypothetical protein
VDFVTNFFNLDCIASGMNDGLAGMVPTELKELTELQDLHFDGTALTGSLSLLFCIGDFSITNFEADCAGRDEAEVQCSCCTVCCGRIDDQPYTCGRNPFANVLSVLRAEANLDRRALSSPETPQYQSLNWLAYDDPANLDPETDPGRDILERFILAAFFFATDGGNWTNQFNFLQNRSVCEWYNGDPPPSDSLSGISCNERGHVANLRMGKLVLPFRVIDETWHGNQCIF